MIEPGFNTQLQPMSQPSPIIDPKFAQASIDIVAILDRDVALHRLGIRQNHARAKVRFETQDGIADVTEMGNLHAIEEHGVLEFRCITEHAIIAHDDIAADIGAGTNLAILANDRGPFDHRAVLDDRPLADEHIVGNVGHPDGRAQSRRLEVLLDKIRQLLQRIPNVPFRPSNNSGKENCFRSRKFSARNMRAS